MDGVAGVILGYRILQGGEYKVSRASPGGQELSCERCNWSTVGRAYPRPRGRSSPSPGAGYGTALRNRAQIDHGILQMLYVPRNAMTKFQVDGRFRHPWSDPGHGPRQQTHSCRSTRPRVPCSLITSWIVGNSPQREAHEKGGETPGRSDAVGYVDQYAPCARVMRRTAPRRPA